MSSPRYTNKHLLFAACIGAALGYGALSVINNNPAQHEPVAALAPAQSQPPAIDREQVRKDLSTRFIGDPRTLGEKLRDFVAENSSAQTLPIACKVIADLAENPDALSNQELDALYHNQTDSDLQRVIAQVLSLRGDNHLIEQYVDDIKPALHSDNPAAKRNALQTLAKTHYAGAATALVPLLEDEDASVKLDALLALRATGNESHIHYVEPLLNHPDESVRWLAHDAINQLQNLSTRARTKLTSADIAAGLPL